MPINGTSDAPGYLLIDQRILGHVKDLLLVLLGDVRPCKTRSVNAILVGLRHNSDHSDVASLDALLDLLAGATGLNASIHDTEDTNNFHSVSWSHFISEVPITGEEEGTRHLTSGD